MKAGNTDLDKTSTHTAPDHHSLRAVCGLGERRVGAGGAASPRGQPWAALGAAAGPPLPSQSQSILLVLPLPLSFLQRPAGLSLSGVRSVASEQAHTPQAGPGSRGCQGWWCIGAGGMAGHWVRLPTDPVTPRGFGQLQVMSSVRAGDGKVTGLARETRPGSALQGFQLLKGFRSALDKFLSLSFCGARIFFLLTSMCFESGPCWDRPTLLIY